MMMPFKEILENVMDQMNNPLEGPADDRDIAIAKQKINEAYREVCGAWPWTTLQQSVTLTDSSYIMPSDCRDIRHVMDEDKNPYSFAVGAGRPSNFMRNWYFDTPTQTPLAEGALAVTESSIVLSSATAAFPATDCSDEYIRIGTNTGIYKIESWTSTSVITLYDNFRGVSLGDAIFQVRPKGTRILNFNDSAGTALTPTGVIVTYVRYPLPLFRDEDVLELPGYGNAVIVKALQKLLAIKGFNQAADRKQGEYLAALSEMKASEPHDNSQCQPTPMFRSNYAAGGSTTGSYIKGLSLINNG
jgi:hypothetical protein